MSAPTTRPDRSSYAGGVVMLLLAGTVWSMMGLGVRYIDDGTPLQILFYRSLGMIPALLLFITWRHGGRLDRAFRQMGTPTILGGLALVFAFCGSIISLKETTVANAVFLLATAPFFAAILGRIVLGEKVRPTTWITIFVGSFGVAIMVYDGLSAGKVVGNVAALVCAVFFAVFTIAMRAEKHSDAVPAVLLGGVYASIASGLAIVVAGQPLAIPPEDVAIALALGAGALGFGLILYTLGSRHVPAAESTLLAMMEVVLSPIWVWLIFGETAGPLMLIGGGILLAALFGNAMTGVIRERRAARADVRLARTAAPHGNGHAAPQAVPSRQLGLAGPRPANYRAMTGVAQDRSHRQ